MSGIKTEHNGYEITYGENSDLWSCWSLGMEASTLTALKTKINQFDVVKRRLSNVPVLYNGYQDSCQPGVATLLDPDGKHVWITLDGANKGSRDERKKVELDRLIPYSPENIAVSVEAARLRDEGYRLQKEGKDLLAALPRMTVADLAGTGAEDLPPVRKRARR
jgi:hypothetical protein